MQILVSIFWILFSLLMIVAGFIGCFAPLATFLNLVIFLPWILLFGAIASLCYYFVIKDYEYANLLLVDSLFNFLFALVFFAGGIDFTGAVIVYCVAFMSMFKGILGLSYVFELRKQSVKNWIWVLLAALANIVLACIFIIYPNIGGITLGIMISLLFIFFGIGSFVAWLGLRQLSS